MCIYADGLSRSLETTIHHPRVLHVKPQRSRVASVGFYVIKKNMAFAVSLKMPLASLSETQA